MTTFKAVALLLEEVRISAHHCNSRGALLVLIPLRDKSLRTLQCLIRQASVMPFSDTTAYRLLMASTTALMKKIVQ
jgi:hypothetical protein